MAIDRLAVVALGVVAVGGFAAGGGGASDSIAGGRSAATALSARAEGIEPGRSLVCKPPRGARKLPASSRHGLIQHLRQYPVVGLATSRERARARRVLAQLVSAAEEGNWRDLRAAARAGYGTRTATRKPGDRSVHYFHSERRQEPRGRVVLDPRRPKALIYANAPGRPLVLVGAMWSMRDGERGPTPGGPITRWHSHVVCAKPGRRGLKPPASGTCPPGARLIQGRSEMFHVWFTGELRSAFAIRAPEPELCAADLLPGGYCAARR
ncbi:MAG: hypothetical protein ACRDNY_00985 [Gaiellaceae bacterium]